MKTLLLRLLEHRRLPWIAAVVAMLLCSPALSFGFLADDWFQRGIVAAAQGEVQLPLLVGDPPASPLDHMFVFFDGTPQGNRDLGELGLVPWWAPPGIKAAFLRPLAACTHLLDYAAWPNLPALMHLHSLLWLGLAVLAAAALYLRLGGAPRAAALATLLFALEDAHAGPATWLANRNALVALCVAVPLLLAHHSWRQRRRWPWLLAAVALLALDLMAGEAALAACGFLAAYALCLDRGSLRARLVSLLPYAPVLTGWAAWYRLGGYGTAGARSYVDPTSLEFVPAVLERVPVLLATQFFQAPADAWIALPRSGQLGFSAIALLALLLVLAAVLPVLRARPQARFWGLAMALAAVPICASFPMERLILFVGLGAAGLLGEAVDHAGWLEGPAPASRPRRYLFSSLMVVHLVFSPLLLPGKTMLTGMLFGVFERGEQSAPCDEQLREQSLVWVNGASIFVGIVPVIRALNHEPRPRGQFVLAHMLTDMQLQRPDERSLVATAEAGFLATPPEQLVRDVRIPFVVGEPIERGGVVATVQELMPDGRPRTVHFAFPVSLDDPSLRWVVWQEQQLLPFTVPAVGETVRVPPSWPPFFAPAQL